MPNQSPDLTPETFTPAAGQPRARIISTIGIMKRILVGTLVVVLASCASPRGNNTLKRWSPAVATWSGAEAITLPMDTVALDGRLVFFVVDLSVNGKRESFIVDSGSSSTSFTDAFVRTLRAKVFVGQMGVIYGLGWSRKTNTILLDSIDLGFASVNKLEIPSTDILGMLFHQQLVSKEGRPLAGIIGVDLLVPLGASLDLARSTITFRKVPIHSPDPAPAPVPPVAGQVPHQP